MNKSIAVVVLLGLVSVVAAGELPCNPEKEYIPSSGYVQLDQVETKPFAVNEPVWEELRRMTNEERQNAQINIEISDEISKEAADLASWIEQLWNNGNFEEALGLFPRLAEFTDVKEIAIGCAWRIPVPTYEQTDWGTDVRIGNRTNIYVHDLDIHRASGHLFALVLYPDASQYQWAINLSTDGGSTWSETYSWWASYQIDWVDAAVIANHCHVAYLGGTTQNSMRLRRFKASDGQSENYNNGSSYITVHTLSSGSFEEVNLTSNQDFYNNRLYYLGIVSDGVLKYFWDDTGAVSWSEVNTGVSDADRGLDASCNEGYATYFLVASYFTTGNSVKVDARGASWDNLYSRTAGASTDYTAIGAYGDTLLCAYDHMGSNLWVRYVTSYDGGSTWYWGFLDDTTTIQESPDVACRADGGEGVIYRFYTPTRELRYTWRNYAGSWTTPVNTSDNEPYYNKPSIEYLGSGAYGLVYLSWTSPVARGAYFDRSDWGPEVTEEPSHGFSSRLITIAPNPVKGLAKLSFATEHTGNVKVLLYDAAGRMVATIFNGKKNAGTHTMNISAKYLAAGIYFVHVETEDFEDTRSMMILK